VASFLWGLSLDDRRGAWVHYAVNVAIAVAVAEWIVRLVDKARARAKWRRRVDELHGRDPGPSGDVVLVVLGDEP
jgi:peptidoglycan/LPS O-acetylase OafA/YrhL